MNTIRPISPDCFRDSLKIVPYETKTDSYTNGRAISRSEHIRMT